ncbi:MAG: HAMP domain-containing sensor histidine kinase [Pseudomonadota bacterium]
MTGLALGKRQIALEATAFSVMTFLAFWIANFWLVLPTPQVEWQTLVSAVTLAVMIQAGVLCAVALVTQGRRADREARERIAAGQTGQTIDLRGGVKLPASMPGAVVSVTPQGRIRSVEGDPLLLGSYKLGELETQFLDRISDGLSERLMGRGAARLRYPSGYEVQWLRRAGSQGAGLLAYPLTGQVHPADADSAELKDALRQRTTFFASLGHDLKTPLNAIIGFSDMMKSGLRGPMPEAYQDYAEIIHESGEDLLLLVDDMLDLAKADAQSLKLEFQPVELAASGESVMRQLGAMAERAGVTLTMDGGEEDVWADADARAVRQIWQNLISNAIKYSDEGSVVSLSVFQKDGQAVLAVEDSGAGMDEDDLRRLAEPFAQGKNAHSRKGTGLGLAVVKQFADLHGGQVKVATRLGEGTRVEVSLSPADRVAMGEFEEAAE